MTDFVSNFITAIVSNGIIPKKTSEIVPSDRFRRISGNSDRGNKRSLSYWLKIEHDFAYGYAKDFKTGLEYRFKSYSNDKNLTRADIDRIKIMLKAREAEREVEIAQRHAKIATRAATVWGAAKTDTPTPTPYEAAKGIKATSARYGGHDGHDLIIPIYEPSKNGWDLVSWQRIYPDGKKRFPFGGKKQGCCHVIGQIDPTKPMILVEGYATGATIKAALPDYSVVVAFDAGNLLPVAKALRGIYKTTPIIIGADNDESQTGQKAAIKTAQAVENCTVNICPESGKDFNDIGLEATKLAFRVGDGGEESPVGLRPQSTAPAVTDTDWQNFILTDTRGKVLATSMQNIILHTMHHHSLEGVFSYDEFRQSIILKKCPPWLESDQFKVRQITDNDVTMTCGVLETFGLSPSHEKVFRAINVVAENNKFHSAKAYMEGLVWDKVPRLDNFLFAMGCRSESPQYLSFVLKKWMTAAVKRLFEPGCKFDHVLILESQQQGFYKSTALRELATFEGESYHTDGFSVIDIGREYATLKLQGVILVELSELSGFNKKDDETIRHWITQSVDEVRLPYERSVSKFPRKFVLCATTNSYDYLKDPSGNRRYWPVTIDCPIDIEFIKQHRAQMWAEAVALYRSGLYIGPTAEENALADYERGKRLQSDAWEDIVLSAIDKSGLDEFRTSDILAKMDLKTNEKNERAARRIAAILKSNSYVNEVRWNVKAGKSERVWAKNG